MIPKKIHQIWVGDKTPPTEYLETWKRLPGFEYKLWTEKELSKLDMLNQDKFDFFMDRKVWHGVADIARVEILFQYGGFYVDADTKRLRLLPDSWFDNDSFAVRAYDNPKWKYRITNGHIGSIPKGKLITEYRYQIKQAKKFTPCWSTIGGTLLTDIIQNKVSETLVLEPYTFYPTDMKGNPINYPDGSISYATHVWGSKNKDLYSNKT